MCCAVAVLMGCASTARQMSESSLDERNLERDEAPSSTGLCQPLILDERAFRKLNLDTNTAVTLDEENFRTFDEKEDWQINLTEFSTQAPKHSTLYSLFGDAEQINNNHFSWDQQESQPHGLQVFSIRF